MNLKAARVRYQESKLTCEDEANAVLSEVKGHDFVVTSVKKGNRERNPYPPLPINSAAGSFQETGVLIKEDNVGGAALYEGVEVKGAGQTALVSYIRTDSVRISDEAYESAKSLIAERFGKEYLAGYRRTYKNKNTAQDAHEAIRPTHFDLDPKDIVRFSDIGSVQALFAYLDRFLAIQMAAARVDTVSVEAVCGRQVFRTMERRSRSKGFPLFYTRY